MAKPLSKVEEMKLWALTCKQVFYRPTGLAYRSTSPRGPPHGNTAQIPKDKGSVGRLKKQQRPGSVVGLGRLRAGQPHRLAAVRAAG